MTEEMTEGNAKPDVPRTVWCVATIQERWDSLFRVEGFGRPKAPWGWAGMKEPLVHQLCTGCGKPLDLREPHIFWRDPAYGDGYGEDGHAHLLCLGCVADMLNALAKART